MSRVTIYRRFAGKDALVRAVLLRELRRFFAAIDEAVSGIEATEDRLVHGFAFALQFLHEHALLNRFLRTEPELLLPYLTVDAGPLSVRAAVGVRTRLGGFVRLVPRPVAVHPMWLRAVSPVAARISPGARTAGAAKGGRTEYYGVTDLHHIDAAHVSWEGADAGALAAVRPAVTFGFSSVPAAPSLARVRTTVTAS
ncbi:TetR/AcrR family transcriptional regulator [uncultured Arthrobacter sp.]|uniref:TetR/AcrR family transcriptional regulator n=1 Tax=uncultured Arthrobacter sp. TaxID=114050 RepID=UPI0032162420